MKPIVYPVLGTLLMLSACASSAPTAMQETEGALHTDGEITSQSHRAAYYPSGVSLNFAGFVVGIDKSPVDKVSVGGDIHKHEIPGVGEGISGDIERIGGDSKLLYISQIYEYSGEPFSDGSCAHFSTYEANSDYSFHEPCSDRHVGFPAKESYKGSWTAVDILKHQLTKKLEDPGDYTHLVVVVTIMRSPLRCDLCSAGALHPGEAVEDNKQISFADKEARIMGKKGDFDYRYNGQISVDSDTQIIVGQHLSQNANDKQELKPALEQVKGTTGELPDKLSADNGYLSGDNLEALDESPVDVYIATDKGEKKNKIPLSESERKLVKADFDYNAEENTFACPGGQRLEMKRQSEDGTRTYQGEAETCANCPYQSRCCQSKKGNARSITCDDKEPLRQQMNSKMEKEDAKAVYKERKIIVEPVFGQIKNMGFRGFSVRGKEKAAGEFSLVCAVHNIKKIAKAMIRGVVRPECGKLIANPTI